MNFRFSVIIPTKDRQEILKRSLTAIVNSKGFENLEIVIINDSEKELQLPFQYDNIIVYRNAGSGVATARNTGASKATCDWLIFMDDDMLVGAETFSLLHPFCETFPESCLNVNWVYPAFIYEKASSVPFIRYLKHYGFDSLEGWSSDVNWDKKNLFLVNGITSQFLLMHKNTFEKAGGYNTLFPYAGFEDHDFSSRLKKRKINIYVDPKNMVFHNESDKIDIKNWLLRKKRGGITRRVAVAMGYADLQLHYNLIKRIIYSFIYFIRTPILYLLNNWPATKKADKLFFLGVNLLLGTFSYIGYTSKEAKSNSG